MTVHRFRAHNLVPDQVARLRKDRTVIVLDPGAHGVFCTRTKSGDVMFHGALDLDGVVASFLPAHSHYRKTLPVTLIIENQFLGKNFATSSETTLNTGFVIGYLARETRGDDLFVVHLAPATWQSAQRKRVLGNVKPLDRKAGIELAIYELSNTPEAQIPACNKADLEGVASAFGILRWFERLPDTKLKVKIR